MAETRQGVLPKYSILQRIDLSSQNDLVNVSDAKEYTYTLDPSFTFAKGARKSIAVRAVDIYNVIPNGQSKTAYELFKGRCLIQYMVPTWEDVETVVKNEEGEDVTVVTQVRNDVERIVNAELRPISYTCTNDIAVSMNEFARSFAEMFFNAVSETGNGNGLLDEHYDYAYNPNSRLIQIEFTTNPDNDWYLIKRTMTPTKASRKPRWIISSSNVFDIYNTDDASDIEIAYDRTPFNKNSLLIFITLPATILDYRSASLCSSINPWTKNNLIAPLSYSSDTLTKVFPYNGCTEAKFWFINNNGEKVRWRSVRGYIDLELIIDNSDSYAMTGDN